MGTRNLICVYKDGAMKVAQYCQWDGYPEGQGEGIRKFLKEVDLEEFRNRVDKVNFVPSEDYVTEKMKEAGDGSDGWMTFEEGEKFSQMYPEWSRDTGADILTLIMKRDDLLLVDSSDFITDGTFCEWAYVVDLDRDVLTVYGGCETKCTAKSHFNGGIAVNSEFAFSDLPDNKDDWRAIFEAQEEEDY